MNFHPFYCASCGQRLGIQFTEAAPTTDVFCDRCVDEFRDYLSTQVDIQRDGVLRRIWLFLSHNGHYFADGGDYSYRALAQDMAARDATLEVKLKGKEIDSP